MVDAGIKIDEALVDVYQRLKKRGLRYFTAKIEAGILVLDHEGGTDATWADFVNSLPKGESRYAVFDFEYKTEEKVSVTLNKLLPFFWCPEDAPVKQKMTGASTFEKFKSKFEGLGKGFQPHDVSDLDWDAVRKSL